MVDGLGGLTALVSIEVVQAEGFTVRVPGWDMA